MDDDVRFTEARDGTHIAYRVLDAVEPQSSLDIVMCSGGLIPMEAFDGEPGLVRLLEGLCALGRLVVFDRRGLGLSDPIVDWERPVLDQWADDLSAVVDATDPRELVLFGWDGYGVATRYAARRSHPMRAFIVYGLMTLPDDEWAAGPRVAFRTFRRTSAAACRSWGTSRRPVWTTWRSERGTTGRAAPVRARGPPPASSSRRSPPARASSISSRSTPALSSSTGLRAGSRRAKQVGTPPRP